MKTFNTITCPSKRGETEQPRLILSGIYVAINKKAQEALGLSIGDRIAFEHDGADFYLRRDEHGFALRQSNGLLKITNTNLVASLRLAAGMGRMGFLLGEQQGDRWMLHVYIPRGRKQNSQTIKHTNNGKQQQ